MHNEDIVVVLDTEYTAWEGSLEHNWSRPGELQEMVQIGAIKLEVCSGMREVEAFETFIRPTINPLLSDYFVNLTGITQALVDDEGTSFPEALAAFAAFMGPDTGKTLVFGYDKKIIELNCRLNNVTFPFEADFIHDVEPFICKALEKERRTFFSSELPELLGFPKPGSAHQAIDDARCLAEALRILRFDTENH